jgi:hypothetical protein
MSSSMRRRGAWRRVPGTGARRPGAGSPPRPSSEVGPLTLRPLPAPRGEGMGEERRPGPWRSSSFVLGMGRGAPLHSVGRRHSGMLTW